MQGNVDTTPDSPALSSLRWSRASLWLGIGALCDGLLSLALFALVVGPEVPDWWGTTLVFLIMLSLPIAAVGAVCAIVGMVRREGLVALAALGLNIIAVLPAYLAPALAIAYIGSQV